MDNNMTQKIDGEEDITQEKDRECNKRASYISVADIEKTAR